MGKLTKVFLALGLLICIASGVYMSLGGKKNLEVMAIEYDEGKIVKVIAREAMPVHYKDPEHLLSTASLVVLGKPIKSENIVVFDSEQGIFEKRYTLTEVELTNVFTDKSGHKYKVGDIIKVGEPTYVMDVRGTGLVKFTINDYEGMEKEKEYFLVLEKEVVIGEDVTYAIVGLELGKHELNNSEEMSVLNHTQPHPANVQKEEYRVDLFKKFQLN